MRHPQLFARFLQRGEQTIDAEVRHGSREDALRALTKKRGLWAYICQGKTYDAGDKLGFLKATVEIALENAVLGEPFRNYLKSLKL